MQQTIVIRDDVPQASSVMRSPREAKIEKQEKEQKASRLNQERDDERKSSLNQRETDLNLQASSQLNDSRVHQTADSFRNQWESIKSQMNSYAKVAQRDGAKKRYVKSKQQ